MSKGLEAFKNDILSRLKQSDIIFLDVRNAIHQVEKELKALEIIIKKYMSPKDFILIYYTLNNKKWVDYEEYKRAYLDYYEDDEYMLTQEEVELLKEVLMQWKNYII